MMDCRWRDQRTSLKYGYSHACIQYTGSTMTYPAKHHASYAAEESGQALINPMNHEKKSQAECLATQRKGRCGDDTWQRLGHAKLLRLRLFLHLLKLGYKEIEVSPLDNNHTAKKRSSRSS